MVSSACINCHVDGGVAGGTRLIFAPGDDSANFSAIREFADLMGDSGDTLLAKISGGLQHGGGIQFSDDSTEYEAMQELLYSLYPPPDPVEFYVANVKELVVEGVCISCHRSDGLASNTQLIFSPGSDDANVKAIRAFMELRGDDGQTILSKISGGQSHGGGALFSEDSAGYIALAELLNILKRIDSRSSDVEGNGFFDGVTLANAEQTLRRAALILAGRLPTATEIQLARTDEAGLREAILALMDGPGFHDFILRSANDRLHTDAFLNGLFPEISDLNGTGGSLYPVGAEKYFLPQPYTEEEYQAREDFSNGYKLGVARAPLELIAYVVENDLPYTEILTADYTMVNWYSAQVFRSDVEVGFEGNPKSFAPGRNNGQVVKDESYDSEFIQDSGTRVLSHSGFIAYPHAGLLNDMTWLNRYPTTETNRNRARARWTFYHFLGIDIETSAPRTTDPEALADTNNPTLNNPACTVCHNRLDPVAGAYQNYGNEGFFRDAWGGLDSLPDTYKHPQWFDIDEESPYQYGDTWFRDMLSPGYSGIQQPEDRADDSLSWLAEQITSDSRFGTAAVSFWWPALMGSDVLLSPEVATDANYQQLTSAFNAQRAQIQSLAADFEANGFILKQLLADMALSPWFRAKAVSSETASGREVELASLGIDRLLTPEELNAKNEAVLGYTWDKHENSWIGSAEDFSTALTDRFRLYYGGTDSVGVKERSRAITALMANVAERQALQLACGVTTLDFFENGKVEDRRLFNAVSYKTTPLTELSSDNDVAIGSYQDATTYEVSLDLDAGTRAMSIQFTNDAYDNETGADRNLYVDKLEIFLNDQLIETIEGENFESSPGFSQTTYPQGDTMGGVHGEDIEGSWQSVGWILWGNGFVSVHTDLPDAGNYRFRVTAWGSDYGDGVAPAMTLEIAGIDTSDDTRGSRAIRSQIKSLYKKMLGDDLLVDDPEIDAVYELLIETWEDRKTHEQNHWAWDWQYEECLFPREIQQEEWDSELGSDPKQMIYTWSSVVYYFLTHFDYLHE